MSHQVYGLAVAVVLGLATGICYFGGLWFSIKYLTKLHSAGLWLMLSLLVRTLVSLSVFYFFFANNWQLLTSALVGFVLARVLITSQVKRHSNYRMGIRTHDY